MRRPRAMLRPKCSNNVLFLGYTVSDNKWPANAGRHNLGSDIMSQIDIQENERRFVVPGEEIGDSSHRSGMGTYARDGKVFASQTGIVNIRSGYINVQNFAGKYLPRQGDSVIGVIRDIGPNSWFVDISCPYNSMLHASETPWKIDYGMTGQYLQVGDVILAKVNHIDEIKNVNLTIKEHGLRKLSSGQVLEVDYTKVPRVIGKGGSMISILKERTGCKIFIGQNGVIWIDGELDGIAKATQAINIISRDAQKQGLTDTIREFLGATESHEPDEELPDAGDDLIE